MSYIKKLRKFVGHEPILTAGVCLFMFNDDESRQLSWFYIDNLPSNITSHTRNYLEKYGDILKEALLLYENK